MSDKTPLRFRWSHRAKAHRTLVKVANRGLAGIPFAQKYRVTQRLRDNKPPYSLVGQGDVVVQVGAPADTLNSGRSRGMHLALRSRQGKAIIVEPDPSSAAEFERRARQLGLDHVTVVNAGAWSEPSELALYVDPKHPATNFVEGTVDYDEERMKDFQRVVVPVKPLDQILEEVLGNHGPVRLLSITTNNSEREILQGAEKVLGTGLRYLALARTGDGYDELAGQFGFDYLATDDRGFTYSRRG